MEDALVEWAFEITLSSDIVSDECFETIGEEILRNATSWADQRDLGIGGGFRVKETRQGAFCYFDFGLTATLDNQLIDRADAEALVEYISVLAEQRGCTLEGGCRPFSEDELDITEDSG